MVKKFSLLALAGLIALPGVAAASSGPGALPQDLERKVNDLSRQLDELKAQLARQKEALGKMDSKVGAVDEKVGDLDDLIDEKSEAWDLAARFKLFGDFRSRVDYMNGNTMPSYSAGAITQGMAMALPMPRSMGGFGMGPGPYTVEQIRMATMGMKMFSPQMRAGMFQMMGLMPDPAQEWENETMWTNRLRINMRVKATENVEFKGRLAMYKAWGMQSNPTGGGPFTLDGFSWDGNSTRQPTDNALRVDRAFVNWNNVAGLPMWFSIGRRPTTDGPPGQFRLGLDKRQATPVNYMNYPFDGISLGYAYSWGNEDLGSGRIRFCYGRGFEDGLEYHGPTPMYTSDPLNDMDFAGFSWDVFSKGHRFLNIQSFLAANLVNTPDGVTFPNPLEMAGVVAGNGILDKTNLGNILHTSIVYNDKVADLNYFVSLGWSRTDPKGYDELGNSLLGSWWADLDKEDGYSVYAGIRYDIPNVGLKLGLEYNYGSQYWVGMAPGHDDLYLSKLNTRGHVGEIYLVYDLPTGEAISKYAKTFVRLGYQHYQYDYTGSGSWLGAPVDVDELASDPLNAQFFPALDDMDQVYLTFEAFF